MADTNNDEYALISEKEIEKLKKEVEDLKQNPIGKTKQGKDLLDNIKELNENIRLLVDTFEEAGKEFKNEVKSKVVEDQITPVNNKVELLVEQNKKIANALVSLAEMVKEIQTKDEEPKSFMPPPPKFTPSQQLPTYNKPSMPSKNEAPQRVPVREFPTLQPNNSMPPLPPPPGVKKNKGLKGLF